MADYTTKANKLFDSLKQWLKPLETLQKQKNLYSLEELNKLYIDYMLSYIEHRKTILAKFVLPNSEYYEAVKKLAQEEILFDILIDGYSIDINRNDPKNSRILPILPYPNQLDLIDKYEHGSKGIIMKKSRRGGASLLSSFFMRRGLIHRQNFTMITTHKDKESLDAGKADNTGNSTFSRIDMMLDNSIFVPDDWKDSKKYNTKERRKAGTAIHRSYNPISITYGTNKLTGAILGKGLATGSAINEVFLDEFDVVCDLFPNSADQLFSAFGASANRVIIYSTYRSINYPMYKTVLKNDTETWDFVDLYWKDNPTCNNAWFKYQCGKLDNDPVAIARELERDPSASIAGRVWPNLKEEHFITLDEAMKRWNGMKPSDGWVTTIGSDNGGTKMSQNYNLIKVHVPTGTIFIASTFFIDNTSTPGDVLDWALDNGFDLNDNTIYADRAIKADTTFSHHSTSFLLREQGFNVIGVSNVDIVPIHRAIRQRINENKFYANRDDTLLVDLLKLYRYKDDGTINKKDSHLGDAITYFYRGFFLGGTLNIIERD